MSLKIITALKLGACVICEVFEKEQIKYRSGGQCDESLLYSIDELHENFEKLEILTLKNALIMLDKCNLHKGKASVIQFLGKK